mgnify:CR=1 FL=1
MSKVLIIAEAGVNHNGNLETAKQLARVAKESGADIVKFQTAKLESLVSKLAPMAEYQKTNTGKIQSQMEMLKNLLLTYEEFIELAYYCQKIGIRFLSTPFDIESIEFLSSLGCNLWKVPSGEITNLPYLQQIGKKHQEVILSTGMSTLEEVRDALKVLQSCNAGKITLLHCTTEYPAPFETVNLRAMLTLREEFDVNIGYSDHTLGIEVPIAAVALGATVIEKHFTLSRDMEGPDHKASLEPEELKKMVDSIRNIEMALGNGEKIPSKSEIANISVARKRIIAKRAIREGELLTEDNLTTKRPGNGISPMRWYDVIGTRAIRNFAEDELIEV